jgi:hypothetical protein
MGHFTYFDLLLSLMEDHKDSLPIQAAGLTLLSELSAFPANRERLLSSFDVVMRGLGLHVNDGPVVAAAMKCFTHAGEVPPTVLVGDLIALVARALRIHSKDARVQAACVEWLLEVGVAAAGSVDDAGAAMDQLLALSDAVRDAGFAFPTVRPHVFGFLVKVASTSSHSREVLAAHVPWLVAQLKASQRVPDCVEVGMRFLGELAVEPHLIEGLTSAVAPVLELVEAHKGHSGVQAAGLAVMARVAQTRPLLFVGELRHVLNALGNHLPNPEGASARVQLVGGPC